MIPTLNEILNNNIKNKKLSKIPFLTAAIPNKENFWKNLIELSENGADIIEIGIPFSDPVADGQIIAAASQRALANGADLNYILGGLKKYRTQLKCGIVLMGYSNPFIQYAWLEVADKNKTVQETMAASLKIFSKKAAEAGVNGLIVPDLPFEEMMPWKEALKEDNIDLIALVGPNTSLKRMEEYAKIASAYVYIVSVLGTTGVRQTLATAVEETIIKAKKAFNLPLALGFGLSSPRQLDGLKKEHRPEAVVFGSALIKHLESGGTVKEFMKTWQE